MKRKIATSLLIALFVLSVGESGAQNIQAPTIISPANGAISVSCKPTLQWSRVTFANSYDLEVAKTATFATPVVKTSTAAISYTFTVTLTASTIYYWRVRGVLGQSEVSNWTTASFTTGTCTGGGGTTAAPSLISPANNTTWTQSLYPIFQWQSVTGASSYTIQVSRSSTDFTSAYLVKEATTFGTSYTIDTALTNCTSYYWRVAGVAGSTGSWSSVWKFTVQVPPSQPVPITPFNAAILTTRRPTLTWEASTGATAYTLEIDGATYSVSTTSFTPYSSLSLGQHTWRVRATSCGGGQTSDWSPSRTFTIDLNDVVLKKPENGTTVSTSTPTFEWESVEGATKYKLEVRQGTISGQKLFEADVSGTTFTPSALLNPGTYAWHVMSYMSGAWTGSWSSKPFTFTIQTESLPAPQLTAPVNGAVVDFPLTLRWSAVSGVYSYTLEYSRDVNFSGATAVTLFGTEYVITSALQEGRWYWHVKANTSQDSSGPWSSSWSFEVGLPVPQLLSPANGSSQSTSAVSFDWSDVTSSQIGGELYDMDHYMLQYSTSSTFESQNTISIDKVGTLPLRDSRYGPINLGNGIYYWRVKAVYNKYPEGTVREGSWSPTFSFTIATGGASIPSLISPVSGSVMRGSTVTLVWTTVESSGITGYALVYFLGTAASPGNPSQWIQGSYTEVIIPGQSTSSYAISLPENTSDKPFYWWSVATINTSGQKGSFPSPLNFSIDNTAPNISLVELLQPVNTTLATRIPTFTWRIPLTNYQDVASWTLEYASDIQLQQNRKTVSGLTNLSTIISGNYASVSYTLPTSSELANGTWYWHISATDAAGNVSAFTRVESFVVNAGQQAPAKAQLISPPNGFQDTPAKPTFSWSQVQGATTYRLQVSTNSTLVNPVIDEDGITATSFTPSADLQAGTYYWRVNSNASSAQWSDVWSFTVSGQAANQVTLSTPVSGAQDMPSTVLFQWQALSGATSYTLEVSTSTSFTSLIVNKTGLTTTSWGTGTDWEANDPKELPDGTYYWRVSSNLPNSTSAVWNFSVKKAPTGGKLRLTVTLSNINGEPISGATITLKKEGQTAATGNTDTSGNVTLSDLDSGAYALEVSATGYTSYTETLNLSADTTKNITLYRGAVIHGYVYYDNTQNPAANVSVSVFESETQLQVVSVITKENGYFAMDNLVDTKVYYIVVENYEDQKKQGIIPVSSPTPANALTVIIKTEGEAIGVVQDEKGAPLPGAKVTLKDSQGQFVNSTTTNNIGSFNLKMTPGKYYVEIALFGYEDYKGTIFTVEYKEIEDLGLITLKSKTGTLAVSVQSEEGTSLDATVTVKDAAGNVITSITVTGGTAVENVVVGTYSLEVTAEGYQSQTVTNIAIESGTTVSQDFVLNLAPGSIKVVLLDTEGLPVAGAEVFVDGASQGTTDETGVLFINDVPPGDHMINVVKEEFAESKGIQTVNPAETLVLELTMAKAQLPLKYVAVVVIIAAAAVGMWYFMKNRGKPPERKPGRGREKSRIPTGARREGLPRQSYREK